MDPLLDKAPCGFLSFRDDGVVVAANTTLVERLGYPREKVIGAHIETLLPLGSRLFYQTHLFPLVRMTGRAQEIFLLMRDSGGVDVGMLVNAARREEGGVAFNDCVLMEVQERRKFEEALLQARRTAEKALADLQIRTTELEDANRVLEEQATELEHQHQQLEEQATELEMQGEELEEQRHAAEEANKAKSAYLAVMSHELRTPLNAIGGYVQLLEMEVHGPITPEQRIALGRVYRSQQHLLGLINEVLNLSRIEAGHVEYHMEDTPIAEIVGQVLPMVEPQAAAKSLTMTADVAADVTVRADRDKLRQILINLLTNAVKFTPKGGRIAVSARLQANAAGDVALEVRDSGIGIPPELVERIFEPFVQVDSERRRNTEGTGLGLAISRNFARGMGGDITVDSVYGEGSTFTMVLPSSEGERAGIGSERAVPG